MRMATDIVELATKHHSLVATWQLRALGLSRDDLYRMRRSNAWAALSSRVLVRTGAGVTDDQKLMAVVLDGSPGAAFAGPTAGWMGGAPGFRVKPIHVVR